MEVSRATGIVTFMFGHQNASDESLKTPNPPEANAEDCLRLVRHVSARVYERTDLPGTGLRIGFIAQEVQSACPDAFGNLIGTAQHSSDHEGTNEREILTLDYARLSAVLWQCCKDMDRRLQEQEQRIQALEAHLG